MDNFKIHDYAIHIFYKNIDLLIQSKIFDNRRIIIFGSSKIALMINDYLKSKNIKIDHFIDNNSKLKFIHNIPVSHPEELLSEYKDDVLILIASAFQEEMIVQLEKMGYKQGLHIIKAVDLPKLLADYSFVNRKNMIVMPHEEIQKRQLKVLKAFTQICDNNDIWYCLAYGTLLGAVRHGGYIPWDDDIDVIVKNEDIERLYKITKKEEDYTYLIGTKCESYLEHIGIFVDHHSLVDLNRFPTQLTTGISIDIFPIYGQPDESKIDEYFTILRTLEENMYCSLYDIKLAHSNLIKMEEFLARHNFSNSDYVGDMLSPYHSIDRFPKDLFTSRKKMKFEDDYYYVPEGYEKILKILYGDYMQYPPIEKRIQRHFYKAYYKE